MRKILLVFVVLLVHIVSFSQDFNKIGAAGISFLLNSQSGQKNLNHDEKVALSILGSFLNEQSNRQHELNVANASSSKIIYTTNGEEIQLVKDNNDNVYLLQNGIIYPISKQLVDQATKASKNNGLGSYSLTEYDLLKLKERFYKEAPINETIEHYEIPEKIILKDFLRLNPDVYKIIETTSKNNPKVLVHDEKFNHLYSEKHFNKVLKNKLSLEIYRRNVEKITGLTTLFTCKNTNDYNGDGYDFPEDFDSITRLFKKGEQLIIVYCAVNYKKIQGKVKLSILNSKGKNLTENNVVPLSQEDKFIYQYGFLTTNMESGIYYISIEIEGDLDGVRKLTERIEIVD